MGKTKGKSSQASPEDLIPLLTPLQALQDLLACFHDRGVIIGGVAASLLGTPRYTVDLDAVFLLSVEDIPDVLGEAGRLGIEPRIADPVAFAHKNRVLLLRHTVSGIDIDLILGILPFEFEMVERSTLVNIGSLKLRLPTPEDLIIMKAIAHRQKDLADIQAIASSHPNLDKERIRHWVEQFGDALDLPDLWKTILPLL
ncbi:MAG: nucleotidyltransferase [Anaerolineales bacterium]|nr:nucleotidyltransferase [Anaerolineales bacterium]